MPGRIEVAKKDFLTMMMVRSIDMFENGDTGAIWSEIGAMETKRNAAASGLVMMDMKSTVVDQIGMSRAELTNLRDALNDYLDVLRDKYLELGNPGNKVIVINRDNFEEAVKAIGDGMRMGARGQRTEVTYRSMA